MKIAVVGGGIAGLAAAWCRVDGFALWDSLGLPSFVTIRLPERVLDGPVGLVESVQQGMKTPAFQQGRIVYDPNGSGKSEHALHHFHGLVLDAYAGAAAQLRLDQYAAG